MMFFKKSGCEKFIFNRLVPAALFFLSAAYFYFRGYLKGIAIIAAVAAVAAGAWWAVLFLGRKYFNFNLKPKQLMPGFKIGPAGIVLLFLALSLLWANALALGHLPAPGNGLLAGFLSIQLSVAAKIGPVMLFYALLLLLFYAPGRKIMGYFPAQPKSELENFLFSTGLGLAAFIFSVFLFSLLGLLYPWAVAVAAVLLFALSYKQIPEIFKGLAKIKLSFRPGRDSAWPWFSFFLVLAILSLLFIINFKPFPIANDDLYAYHNTARLFAEQHRYFPLPTLPMANMAHNGEMLYAAVISLAGSFFTVHLPWLFLLLCLSGFYCLVKYFINDKFALFSLCSVLLIPWNIFFASVSKVEFMLAFYLLLALLAFFNWQKREKNSWLYLAGLFGGLAVGVKYSALVFLLPLYLLIVFLIIQRRGKTSGGGRALFVSILIMLAAFSPWLAKNYFYWGQPFYPYDYLASTAEAGGINPEYARFEQARQQEVLRLRTGIEKTGLTAGIKNLVKLSLGQGVFNEGPGNFGFAPLLVLPLLFFYRKKKAIMELGFLALASLAVTYALGRVWPWYAFFTIMLIYTLAPALLRTRRNNLVFLALALTACLSALYVVPGNIEYLAGLKNREEYKDYAILYAKTAAYINNNLDNAAGRILLAGDVSVAFIEQAETKVVPDPYLAKTGYCLSLGQPACLDYLGEHGFSYLLLSKNTETYAWWQKDGQALNKKHPLSPWEQSIYKDAELVWQFAAANSRLLFNDGYYYLYEIN